MYSTIANVIAPSTELSKACIMEQSWGGRSSDEASEFTVMLGTGGYSYHEFGLFLL
jgi:hypothetical protein